MIDEHINLVIARLFATQDGQRFLAWLDQASDYVKEEHIDSLARLAYREGRRSIYHAIRSKVRGGNG